MNIYICILILYQHFTLLHLLSPMVRLCCLTASFLSLKDTGLGFAPIERGRLNVDLTRRSIVILIDTPAASYSVYFIPLKTSAYLEFIYS